MTVSRTCEVLYSSFDLTRSNIPCESRTEITLYESHVPDAVGFVWLSNTGDCAINLIITKPSGEFTAFPVESGTGTTVVARNFARVSVIPLGSGGTTSITGRVDTTYCKCCPC